MNAVTRIFIAIASVCGFAFSAAKVAGEELSPAPAGSFSVVVIPDTQGYTGRGTKAEPESTMDVANAVFDAHVAWIVDNLESQRIVFVSHVGDIVDRNTDDQWQVARRCMDRLHGKVPYGICVGNHDMTTEGDSSRFQEYFPASRFEAFDWYAGSYSGGERPAISGNNANSFALFSAGGIDFVFLHLECNAPDDVLAWADGILKEHANRLALVTTHMDLGPLEKPTTNQGYIDDPKGRMRWTKIHGVRGNSAQNMWDECFRKHANLRLIFSGDQSRTTAMHLEAVGDQGQTIHSLLSDYTSSGPLRIYRFLPDQNAVEVITYDTTRDELIDETAHVPGRENHQFVIPVNLSR